MLLHKNKDRHFIFFGDSICVGQWVDISKIWVHQTVAAIQQDFAEGSPIAFHNRSINGNTTRQALEPKFPKNYN
jgi:hypothetical protein